MSGIYFNSPWTDQRVEELKRLYALGFGAGRIAKMLAPNGAISRNACISKIHRLGLNEDTNRPLPKFTPRAAPTSRAKDVPVAPKVVPVAIAPQPPSPPPILPPVDSERGPVGTNDLRYKDCRFPIGNVGDPDFRYCAEPHIPGTSWCPGHAIMVWQGGPASQARRTKARAAMAAMGLVVE